MGEATLTVPAEHLELFTAGMAYEVRDNAEWVREHQAQIADQLLYDEERPKRPAVDRGDVDMSKRHLDQSVSVLGQLLDAGKVKDSVTVTATPYEGGSVMVQGLQWTADRIVAPKIKSLSNYSPLSGDLRAAIDQLADTLKWAVSETDRLEPTVVAAMRAQREAA